MTDDFLEKALSLVWNRKCELAVVALTIGRIVFPCNVSLPQILQIATGAYNDKVEKEGTQSY